MRMSSRILICDDEDIIRTMIADVLNPFTGCAEGDIPQNFISSHPEQDDRYRLDFADSGYTAIQMVQNALAENDPYALIFMDVRLNGDMDGVEAIAQIWQIEAGVQVVISSGHHDYTWQSLHDVLGESTDLLIMPKPFDLIALRQMTYVLTTKWELANRKEGDERTQELAHNLAESKEEIGQLTQSREWAYEMARESEEVSQKVKAELMVLRKEI